VISPTFVVDGDGEARDLPEHRDDAEQEEGAVLRGKVELRQKDQPQPPRSALPAHAKEAVATDSAQAKQQAKEEGARREV